MSTQDTPFTLAGVTFQSRLIVGTGKYPSHEVMKRCHEASGAEMVTVAVRRLDLSAKGEASLMSWIDTQRMRLLPNTALCYTAEDAVRTCRLAEELGMSKWVKLEVLGDEKTLYPDVEETLKAARILVKEGFTVLPYTTDDPITARKLEDVGCAAVMPLAAPIGSGLGIRNPHNIRLIREMVKVPVIVDAGVGTASDAAIAMELGVDALLMNTAIAGAKDPVRMATAMRKAVEAGRDAFLAGRIPRKAYASASSPLAGARRVVPALPRLIVITDWRLPRNRLLSALERALEAGPDVAVQHRHPEAPARTFLEEARVLAALCRTRGNPLFVNGRLDVALLVGAHLHLPAYGPTVAEVRPLLPAGVQGECRRARRRRGPARPGRGSGAGQPRFRPRLEAGGHPSTARAQRGSRR